MFKIHDDTFNKLQAKIDKLPVIETHEHNLGICEEENELDIIAFLAGTSYYPSDLTSASHEFALENPGTVSIGAILEHMRDTSVSFDKRYALWKKYHDRTCHTAYARGMSIGLEACWGLKDYSKKSLLDLQKRMRDGRNQDFFDKTYARHNIETMIVNLDLHQLMDGSVPYNTKLCKFVFTLPEYHAIFTSANIRRPHLESILGKTIVTLTDYLDAVELFLKKCLEFGIVGIKDQTAYRREIAYGNPPRARAEEIFNTIMANPRDTFGTDLVKDLDDYLFNQFMILAGKYKLPVQIHTGHMAGIRNEIRKTNPAHLSNVLELHQDVTFDLFHAGWPFMGELLFLGKNYPNVMIDMCWANSIDPLYSIEMFKRALVTVPHSKISGFGGDSANFECQIGFLIQARNNMTYALSEMVRNGWLSMKESETVARNWLYDNPKRIFSL